MECRPSLIARELWQDGVNTSRSYVPGDIDNEALDNIPQHITKTSLDGIPTMARAIAGLKDDKAPGGDGIPPEV